MKRVSMEIDYEQIGALVDAGLRPTREEGDMGECGECRHLRVRESETFTLYDPVTDIEVNLVYYIHYGDCLCSDKI